MVVWKYELEITDRQELPLPAGAVILSVANQRGKLCLWAMVNPIVITSIRCIEIIGTGHQIQDLGGLKYIGTVVIDPLVWHVFERKG